MQILIHEDGSIIPLDNFEVWQVDNEDEEIGEYLDLEKAAVFGRARKQQIVKDGAIVWKEGDGFVETKDQVGGGVRKGRDRSHHHRH